MPKKEDKKKIEQAIADYIQVNGVTSTRDIADGVADTIGYTPSTATVSKVLHDMGYTPKKMPENWWTKNDE